MPTKRDHWRGHYWHFNDEERWDIDFRIRRNMATFADLGREYEVDPRVIRRLWDQLYEHGTPEAEEWRA